MVQENREGSNKKWVIQKVNVGSQCHSINVCRHRSIDMQVHGRVLDTSYLRERKQALLRDLLVEEDVCNISVAVPLPTAPSIMVSSFCC